MINWSFLISQIKNDLFLFVILNLLKAVLKNSAIYFCGIGYELSFAKALSSIENGILDFGWGFVWGTNFGTEFALGDKFSI